MQFDFEENTFIERKRKMPIAKKNFSAAYLDNKLYIIGGETNTWKHTNSCEVYDLDTKRWERTDSLNEGV